MTFAEKLMQLRRQHGWSQEELGDKLGVTRQTISKWELGSTTPEMEKLAAISEIFGITTDELIKGGVASEENIQPQKEVVFEKKTRLVNGEFKSARTVCGKPLVHVNLKGKADGFLAVGLIAKGIFSVGLIALGVVPIGLLALGVIAIGAVAALGIAAQGALAAGVFAFGGVAAGVFAFGGVAFGWVTFGGAAIGTYSFGGYAQGVIAVGGYADGVIAVGDKAVGDVTFPMTVSAEEFSAAVQKHLPNTPEFVVKLFSFLVENHSA